MTAVDEGQAPDYASIDDLFGDGVTEQADVTTPSGRRVRVRGLTRKELLQNGKGTDDSSVIEARNLACCMVAPTITVGQADHWQSSVTPDEIAPISNMIRQLSGLGEGAAKSRVHGDGNRDA